MVDRNHSRRAVSAIPALPGADLDPIFLAIERHISAFRVSQMTCRVRTATVDVEWEDEYDPVTLKTNEDAYVAASKVASDAAYALTTVQPTTIAGVLALVRYIDTFNEGAFYLEPVSPDETVDDWRSQHGAWPETKDRDGIDLFAHHVLANVRRALEALAVQS